ncbi:hypothetical protein PVAG01_01967 [Phlyctema vagabunda]|uniref:Tafazzin n=1 Tax=Phlyctema vagabunda TaxID=108571 RepID=A0ABR4PYK8_9HELO
MPKKRFSSIYSKPQSTVHPSLGSASAASASSRNDAAPSVNDLISNLRKTNTLSHDDQRNTSPITVTPTLPPAIRTLLSLPETPAPRPRGRDRRRYDERGRRLPAGPAAPQSWLEVKPLIHHFTEPRSTMRSCPAHVEHLPGIIPPRSGSLQDHCLREMARQWTFITQYEKYNLAHLPNRMRIFLLSYIAVYGPEDGVGYEGLRDLLLPPPYLDTSEQEIDTQRNDQFFRLDLSCSIGRTVSLKQIGDLVSAAAEEDEDNWEQAISKPLSPVIPHLTHLSLSHPPSNISWPKLLSFCQHVPTITHLSLAHWPVPNLTPNSNTAVVTSQFGRDIQYGAANFYSHFDDDFSGASIVLKRLASSLYSLEWLDITGCLSWMKAFRHKSQESAGLDWINQWRSLHTIVAKSAYDISDERNADVRNRDICLYKEEHYAALETKWYVQYLRKLAGGRSWIDFQLDEYEKWDFLWSGTESLPSRQLKPETDVLFRGFYDGLELRAQSVVENGDW